MDPVLVWALVALAALSGLYDLGRRAIAGASKRDLEEALRPIRHALELEQQRGDFRFQETQQLTNRCDALRDAAELARQDATKHRADHDEHVKLFEQICLQWRAKAGELESQINRVTSDAKNEINGALQGVDALTGTRKGWR